MTEKQSIAKRGNKNPMFGKKHLLESRIIMKEKRAIIGQDPEYNKKLSLVKLGEKNPLWKGDDVGYKSLHQWVTRNVQKPDLCQICNLPKKLDAHNISGTYQREASDWLWCCRKCHQNIDGRKEMLEERMRYKHWKGVF